MTFRNYINIPTKDRNHFKVTFIKPYCADIYINKISEIRFRSVCNFFSL